MNALDELKSELDTILKFNFSDIKMWYWSGKPMYFVQIPHSGFTLAFPNIGKYLDRNFNFVQSKDNEIEKIEKITDLIPWILNSSTLRLSVSTALLNSIINSFESLYYSIDDKQVEENKFRRYLQREGLLED